MAATLVEIMQSDSSISFLDLKERVEKLIQSEFINYSLEECKGVKDKNSGSIKVNGPKRFGRSRPVISLRHNPMYSSSSWTDHTNYKDPLVKKLVDSYPQTN